MHPTAGRTSCPPGAVNVPALTCHKGPVVEVALMQAELCPVNELAYSVEAGAVRPCMVGRPDGLEGIPGLEVANCCDCKNALFVILGFYEPKTTAWRAEQRRGLTRGMGAACKAGSRRPQRPPPACPDCSLACRPVEAPLNDPLRCGRC